MRLPQRFLPLPIQIFRGSVMAAIGFSGLIAVSCSRLDMPQSQDATQGQDVTQDQDATQRQGATPTAIADGLYILGGTDQGLEVSGQQYRYYSEGGEQEWRPVSELTLIQAGLIFDGQNYWCINTPTEPGVCTERGWRTVAESLQDQAAIDAEPSSETEPSSAAGPSSDVETASDVEWSPIAASELSIGGFQLGDPPTEVVQQLGQPQRITKEYYTRYEFPGFTGWFDQDYLVDMRSTRADYCTPSGVCPGMTAAAVEQIYGTPVIRDREDGRFMEYYSDEAACWLKMGVVAERVTSVAVACLI